MMVMPQRLSSSRILVVTSCCTAIASCTVAQLCYVVVFCCMSEGVRKAVSKSSFCCVGMLTELVLPLLLLLSSSIHPSFPFLPYKAQLMKYHTCIPPFPLCFWVVVLCLFVWFFSPSSFQFWG